MIGGHLMLACESGLIAQAILADMLRVCLGQLLDSCLDHFDAPILSHALGGKVCMSSSTYNKCRSVLIFSLVGPVKQGLAFLL